MSNSDRESCTPRRTAPYEDSGEWAGSRCLECTYYTYADAQACAAGGPNFCGNCGNQLVPDEALEVASRTPEELREAAE